MTVLRRNSLPVAVGYLQQAGCPGALVWPNWSKTRGKRLVSIVPGAIRRTIKEDTKERRDLFFSLKNKGGGGDLPAKQSPYWNNRPSINVSRTALGRPRQVPAPIPRLLSHSTSASAATRVGHTALVG